MVDFLQDLLVQATSVSCKSGMSLQSHCFSIGVLGIMFILLLVTLVPYYSLFVLLLKVRQKHNTILYTEKHCKILQDHRGYSRGRFSCSVTHPFCVSRNTHLDDTYDCLNND